MVDRIREGVAGSSGHSPSANSVSRTLYGVEKSNRASSHESEGSESIEYEYETSLYTVKGREIDIYKPVSDSKASTVSGQDERGFLQDMNIATTSLQRIADVNVNYNCHGYTFAEREGWITESEEVRTILKDNGFEPTKTPEKDDVVIYREDGEITHSGVVIGIDGNKMPLIESKFGKYGLYRHYPETLIDAYGQFEYYHSKEIDGRFLLDKEE